MDTTIHHIAMQTSLFWIKLDNTAILFTHIACVILIPYIGGQERLHCSDERLDIAYNNPSVYCQMSGIQNVNCYIYIITTSIITILVKGKFVDLLSVKIITLL